MRMIWLCWLSVCFVCLSAAASTAQTTEATIQTALTPLPQTYDEALRQRKRDAYEALTKQVMENKEAEAIIRKTDDLVAQWRSIHPGDDWMRVPIARLLVHLPVEETLFPQLASTIIAYNSHNPQSPETAALLAALQGHPALGDAIITELAPLLSKHFSYEAATIHKLLDVIAPYSAAASGTAIDSLVKARFDLNTGFGQQLEQKKKENGYSVITVWNKASAAEVDNIFTRMDSFICAHPLRAGARTWEYILAAELSYPIATHPQPVQSIVCHAKP